MDLADIYRRQVPVYLKKISTDNKEICNKYKNKCKNALICDVLSKNTFYDLKYSISNRI